jgi:hypothetical protein
MLDNMIVDQFGSTATILDVNGNVWYGTIIGRGIFGHYIVALHGSRTGEAIFAARREFC